MIAVKPNAMPQQETEAFLLALSDAGVDARIATADELRDLAKYDDGSAIYDVVGLPMTSPQYNIESAIARAFAWHVQREADRRKEFSRRLQCV